MMPKSLYDALPYIYLGLGAATTAVLDSSIKYLPAMLFLAAGAIVFLLRHAGAPKSRRPQAVSASRHQGARHPQR